MLARVFSPAVNGIEAFPVEVEVNSGWGDTLNTECNMKTVPASVLTIDTVFSRTQAPQSAEAPGVCRGWKRA